SGLSLSRRPSRRASQNRQSLRSPETLKKPSSALRYRPFISRDVPTFRATWRKYNWLWTSDERRSDADEHNQLHRRTRRPRRSRRQRRGFNYSLLCFPTGNDFAAPVLETGPETCFRGYDSPHALRPRAERGTS